MSPPPPSSTLFPYTTLFRSVVGEREAGRVVRVQLRQLLAGDALALPVPRRERERITREKRSEEHTSELQSRGHLVCRLLLEKKKREARSVAEERLVEADAVR